MHDHVAGDLCYLGFNDLVIFVKIVRLLVVR